MACWAIGSSSAMSPSASRTRFKQQFRSRIVFRAICWAYIITASRMMVSLKQGKMCEDILAHRMYRKKILQNVPVIHLLHGPFFPKILKSTGESYIIGHIGVIIQEKLSTHTNSTGGLLNYSP